MADDQKVDNNLLGAYVVETKDQGSNVHRQVVEIGSYGTGLDPSPELALRLDDEGTICYIGEAEAGTATSAASWRIKRMTTSGADITIEWADGDTSFDNIYDNRASLSYS